DVAPGAQLAIRTQAATQVHAGRSRQALRARVGQGAWFSYVPHAVVPHATADYCSTTRVDLAPGARALIAEVLSPGRVEYGERFAYRQVRLNLDVRRGSVAIARERAAIRPDPALIAAQFGPWTHVATAYVLGPAEPAPEVDFCNTSGL